jgi:hypothetical protein
MPATEAPQVPLPETAINANGTVNASEVEEPHD